MRWIMFFLLLALPFAAVAADEGVGASPEETAVDTPAAVEAADVAQGPVILEVPAETEPRMTDAFLKQESIVEAIEAIKVYLAEAGPEGAQAAEPGAPEPLVLGVRECVQMALENNAKVLVAADEIDVARARIGQARSRMLPQLSASTAYIHTDFTERNPGGVFGQVAGMFDNVNFGSGNVGTSILFGVVSSIGQKYLEGYLAPRTVPDDDLRRDTFSASQVLYAGGQISAAVKASKYLTESQEWQEAVTFDTIEFETKQAFYDTLLVAALVEVANESVRTFERNLSDATQMFDVGMISNFEVLRAKTELGARQSDLVAAKNALRLAHANLRRILFIPQDTPIELKPELTWMPEGISPREYVARALADRPELKALEKGIDAAKQDLRRVQGQYKPQVAASAEWANTDKGGLTTPDGWTFSVGAGLDIYTGGKRKNEVMEAKARISSLEHQLRDVESFVELDVTSAHIRIQDAMAKIQSELGTVALAQEGLRLAELRFQEGVGTQSETLDAELALTNAETSLFQALRDYAVANASLDKAIARRWGHPTSVTAADSGEPVISEGAPQQ